MSFPKAVVEINKIENSTYILVFIPGIGFDENKLKERYYYIYYTCSYAAKKIKQIHSGVPFLYFQ